MTTRWTRVGCGMLASAFAAFVAVLFHVAAGTLRSAPAATPGETRPPLSASCFITCIPLGTRAPHHVHHVHRVRTPRTRVFSSKYP